MDQVIDLAPFPTTCSSRSSCACAAPAASTSLLSRRWRGLWTRLPSLNFRNIQAGVIKSALARIARRTAVSLLEIRLLESAEAKRDDSRAKSLLQVAARLSPEEIVFLPPPRSYHVIKRGRAITMVLPCFHRATSIELDVQFLRIMPPRAGELPVLQKLSISGNIVNLAAFLNRCPRLRVLAVTFRGLEPDSFDLELATLEAAAALGLMVSRLGIDFNGLHRGRSVDNTHLASLLRVAARVAPWELFFSSRGFTPLDADLLCFHRTRSIEMDFYTLRFTQVLAGEFSALETLTLDGCRINDLVTMIIRCPRLRVLKVTTYQSSPNVMVHSVSLEELDIRVREDTQCRSIQIVTPLLKQLKFNIHGKMNINVSISAPMVEKVSWWHRFTPLPIIFGFWSLESLTFKTIESYKHKHEEGECLQLPSTNVLSMNIAAHNPLGFEVDFVHEMEKLLITNFSVFELHLNTKGHAFGALVLSLFRTHHIRTNTQKLKIVLPWHSQMPRASEYHGICPCDEPEDWRSQSISLIRLQEVKINNFGGCNHGIDFVRAIFGWAPMLARISIRLAYEIKQSEIRRCAMTIYNIWSSYPSVDCFVNKSGEKWSCRSGLGSLPTIFHSYIYGQYCSP